MLHTPEYIRTIQEEREREIASMRIERLAACYRACCNPNRLDRLMRAVRGSAASC